MLSRFERKLLSAKDGMDKKEIQQVIINLKKRLKKFEGILDSYSNARGDSKKEKNRRREIGKARAIARMRKAKALGKKGVKYVPAVALVNAIKKRRAKKRMDGGSEMPEDREMNEIPVQKGLDAKYSTNRIEVPAETTTGFDGRTGFIGIDDQDDFDAPEGRKFDLKFSSAEGDFLSAEGDKKPKVNYGAIIIGIGVGALAIYLLNKYKVLETK